MLNNYLPITTYGMPVLRKVTRKVENIDSELIETIHNMFVTMYNADGIGLAAPQVNINRSFALVDISMIDEFKDLKPLTMINPEIKSSEGSIIFEEGCLSIPGVRAEIERPEKILVKFIDLNEKEVELEASDYFARVIQHEIDHLNGKLFVDYLTKEQKSELDSELELIKKGNVNVRYPLLIHAK